MIKKLILLNKTILECLNEKNKIHQWKMFTNIGIKILDSDFGFVWLNNALPNEWKLVYKTPNLSFQPKKPRINGRSHRAITSGKIDYVKNLKNVPDSVYVSRYMKSFVIIPICYEDKFYGTMVLCFKKSEVFSSEKRILSVFFGNAMAQVITLHQSREKTEKQKETQILLDQEKLKTEFIANATHELRTPLAIIKGNVDLALREKSKKPKLAKTVLKAIDHEIQHLSNIISDLTLITAKVRKLDDRVIYHEVGLKPIIEYVVERCKITAHNKNISIILKSVPSVDILGDRSYLEKMLTNLIRNSIIYGNKNGHITIDVKKYKGFINISIKDNGIGISKEDLPNIFERFYRADKSHESHKNSTGLGLAIVKWIAEIHGGRVSVKSTLGMGSTFTVSLPTKTIKGSAQIIV